MNQLAAWITSAVALTPQATALIACGEALSFSALAERSTAAASTAVNTPALRAYAYSFQGVPFFPLDPTLPQPRRDALLEQSRAWLGACSAKVAPVELLIATSGSSGEPKCVMLSGENLAASVAASHTRLPLQQGDVWLDCLPLYHIGGMSILYRCAAARATVLLHEGFDARRVWDDLIRYRVTHISLAPAMLARLLDLAHGAQPPDTLKYALVGGGALSGTLAARAAGWPLCVSYGMSETASQLATLSPLPEDWTPGCVGTPLPGFEVRIAAQDATGVGVIQARGAAVMMGYAHPARECGSGLQDGWLTTGDLGRLDGSGQLYVLGRRDDMLVSGGVNVHPVEVEAMLLRCPGVRDVALTALPDETWGDRLVALVVGDAELECLAAWCHDNMASALRPRIMLNVAALPRNALGKLERMKLKHMAQELILKTAFG